MTYRPGDFDAHQKMISTTSLIRGRITGTGASLVGEVVVAMVRYPFVFHLTPFLYTTHSIKTHTRPPLNNTEMSTPQYGRIITVHNQANKKNEDRDITQRRRDTT